MEPTPLANWLISEAKQHALILILYFTCLMPYDMTYVHVKTSRELPGLICSDGCQIDCYFRWGISGPKENIGF